MKTISIKKWVLEKEGRGSKAAQYFYELDRRFFLYGGLTHSEYRKLLKRCKKQSKELHGKKDIDI